MESEADLNDEIKKLTVLATSPELYPALMDLNALGLFTMLLTHENTDIL